MKYFKSTLLAISIAGTMFSFSANADFIEADWQTDGDGKAFVDTYSGLEWLQLTETNDMSYNNVSSQLSTTYDGWRLASYDEVSDLMDSIFTLFPNDKGVTELNDASEANGQNVDAYNTFIQLFGVNRGTQGRGYTYGTVINFDGDGVTSFGGLNGSTSSGDHYKYRNDYNNGVTDSSVHVDYGTFLVGNEASGVTLTAQESPSLLANNPMNSSAGAVSVNAPSTLGIFALGGMVLAFRLKGRKQ